MFCPNCGQQNVDTAVFCASCGGALQQPAPGATAPPAMPMHMQTDMSGLGPANAALALGLAIAFTVLCCWPLGIPAIIFAAKGLSANSSGQYAQAHSNVKTAYTWGWICFGVGIVIWILYIVLMVMAESM